MIAFVNFDGEVEPDWDGPLRELLDEPAVAIATGVLLTGDGARVEAAGLEIAPNTATYGLEEGRPRTALPAGPVEVSAATGALMMVRRSDFLVLGGFYEPIFMYGEETDYCLRVDGRIVLHPGSAIRHEHGHAADVRRAGADRDLSRDGDLGSGCRDLHTRRRRAVVDAVRRDRRDRHRCRRAVRGHVRLRSPLVLSWSRVSGATGC